MNQLDAWLTRWLAKEIDFQICIVICSNKKQSAAYLQALSLSSFAPQRQLAGNLCRPLLKASTGQQEATECRCPRHTQTLNFGSFSLSRLWLVSALMFPSLLSSKFLVLCAQLMLHAVFCAALLNFRFQSCLWQAVALVSLEFELSNLLHRTFPYKKQLCNLRSLTAFHLLRAVSQRAKKFYLHFMRARSSN